VGDRYLYLFATGQSGPWFALFRVADGNGCRPLFRVELADGIFNGQATGQPFKAPFRETIDAQLLLLRSKWL